MDIAWLASVSGFAIAMCGTPGPNNTMVAASGANYGFRRTLPFMSGVALGVAVIITVVTAIGSPIVKDPTVQEALKWAGLLYLLWLAWKIASARPAGTATSDEESTRRKPLTLLNGGLFQFVNAKLWVMVAGVVVTYGSTADVANPVVIAVAFAVIFGSATFASTAAWTLLGVGVGRVIRSPRAMRTFNWVMAFLLVASLIPVVLS
jgi:threonine/homoserine/homoserine lactone efflux protein